jgi:hypothetical protein
VRERRTWKAVLMSFYDIFTGIVIIAVYCVFLLERTLVYWLLIMNEHGEHEDLIDSVRRSVIPYVDGRIELYYLSLTLPV